MGSLSLGGCDDGNHHHATSNQDRVAPIIEEVSAVVTPANDTTPEYTFSSSEPGAIAYAGGCTSITSLASSGNNIITFNALAVGYYDHCTITVTDESGNTSIFLEVNSFTVGKPFNDTGVTLCGDMAYSYTGYAGSGTHDNDVDCINGATPSASATLEGFEIANGNDSVPAGQDAFFGRDANPETNTDTDGHAGFSFTKLGADGAPLAIQDAAWSDTGNEALGTKWSCIQDNVTGLMWEVKTNDGGLRDKNWVYTWYNSSGTNDGGDHGLGDTGAGITTGMENSVVIFTGTDTCFDSSRCDTEKFVADVNIAGLCGKSDWSLPSSEELQSIVDKSSADLSIDIHFFAHTKTGAYFSSTPDATNNSRAMIVYFGLAKGGVLSKYTPEFVRLVRRGS